MKLLPRRPRIRFGSRGPFFLGKDLGLWKYAIPLEKIDTAMYVVGRSGKGKSKFLEGFLFQLIMLGKGCGLIDPHGDLANNLLKLLAFHPTDSEQKPWLVNTTLLTKATSGSTIMKVSTITSTEHSMILL